MTDNPLDIKRIHHIEFYVGNAKQAAYYYRKAFGFSQTAYAGLETGLRSQTNYLLEQGNIRFVFTTPLTDEGPVAEHIMLHGDGVKDVAFEVDNAAAAFKLAVERGAQPAIEPRKMRDKNGTVLRAAVKTYGDTVHSFYSNIDYSGPFLPGYQEQRLNEPGVGLLVVDHLVGNVEDGKMDHWAGYYKDVFGFHRYITFDDKDISTEYSALRSVVMASDNLVIKTPINEPATGKKKSQIQEYIEWYPGSGVQHIAMLTKDIVPTIRLLVDNGVEFLFVPESYYDDIPERVGEIKENLDQLRPLGILIDRDDEGYLLQLFTKPVEDRPTLFFEIIQRHGARGFGKGNFKALFEAIEREQDRRGNL